MKFGSVCSGIEAASVAWSPLGWQAAWLSEIEPFPSAVLAHHYPTVPNLGDMTALPERIASGEVEAPDLFCGGTPCQAFSVAGLRNSLDDARGNLSLTFVEIANAIDNRRLDAGLVPAIIFWENVPGVLNTKDNAFGCFLGALAGEDAPLEPAGERWTNAGCLYGPQRTVAWRVLDAQYFGVAQRRRRVFVVASARDDFDPAAVLFESEGVRRDTAPSREAGESIADKLRTGLDVSRVGCLTAGFGKMGAPEIDAYTAIPVHVSDITSSLCAADGPKGVSDQYAHEGKLIAMAHGQGGAEIAVERSPTLTCIHEAPIVAQPIPIHDQATRHAGKNGEKTMGKGNGLGIGQPGDPMNTLTKGDRHAVAQPIPFDTTQITSPSNYSKPAAGDPCHPLAAGAHPPAVVQPITPQPNMQVRRLTPVECERLQGFPDNYTNIPWRKKPESPDGPRYKSLGNSWAVPVVAWIGRRIKEQLS